MPEFDLALAKSRAAEAFGADAEMVTDGFPIVINFRSLAGRGPYSWGSSYASVKSIGAPEGNGAGIAQMWSETGGVHLHIENGRGLAFQVTCNIVDALPTSEFEWTIQQELHLIRGKLTPVGEKHFDFHTPVSDHPTLVVMGMNQFKKPKQGLATQFWTLREIRIFGYRLKR